MIFYYSELEISSNADAVIINKYKVRKLTWKSADFLENK
jgi:hypothetical protein